MIARFPFERIRAVLLTRCKAPARGYAVGRSERRAGVWHWQEKPEIVATFTDAYQIAQARRRATGLQLIDNVSPAPRGPGTGQRMAA